MIFQSQDSGREEEVQFVRDQNDKRNLFLLTEEQKLNINKRLPRGFCLIRKQDYERLGYMRAPYVENIIYEPVKIERQIDLQNPIAKSIDQAWNKKQDEARRSNRISLQTSIQGRSRQSEKIKNIIQRFRKLIKNTQVENYLNKVGLMLGLNQIEVENKKGLLTIDTFKVRYMLILDIAKSTTFQIEVVNQIDQMIEQFMCYVEQARKSEFQNNIQSIQKSIDKITRYLSDTADSKVQGNWYIRRRKKGEKNDIYSEKQILYIAELIRKLPPAYLAGIWEIVYEKPFSEAERRVDRFYLNEIDTKKIRDIQMYVKSKLSQIYRSRERKREKIQAKRQSKKKSQQDDIEMKQEPSEQPAEEQNNLLDQINRIFEGEDQGIKPNQDASAQFGVKKQFDIPELQYEPFSLDPGKFENQQDKPNKNPQIKLEQQEVENMQINDDNSSDSSMITDEDDSDF